MADGEIDPIEKLEELKEFLKDYDVTVHTFGNEKEEYSYLDEEDYCITVKNSSDDELFIDWNGEFTLTYDAWHAHFSLCQYDYEEMLEYLTGILQNNLCSFSVFSNGEWLGSAMLENPVISDKVKVRKHIKSSYSKEFISKIRQNGAEIRYVYWDEQFTKIVKFEPDEF